MLLLPVLVRGINNLSDARYCAGMGASGLIFTLDPALPGAVAPETVRELAGWVAGVELLGEFGADMPPADLNQLVADCGLSRVLLRDAPTTPDPARTQKLVVPVLRVLKNPLPISALPSHETALAELSGCWLSGPFAPAQLPDLLAARPAGIILEGGDELRPGLRDFTELEALFEALQTD